MLSSDILLSLYKIAMVQLGSGCNYYPRLLLFYNKNELSFYTSFPGMCDNCASYNEIKELDVSGMKNGFWDKISYDEMYLIKLKINLPTSNKLNEIKENLNVLI